MTTTLAKLVLNDLEVYEYEIDFILCYDKNDTETDDFINASEYAVNLTDDGHDRLETAVIYVTRDDLDAESLELLMEFIQPT